MAPECIYESILPSIKKGVLTLAILVEIHYIISWLVGAEGAARSVYSKSTGQGAAGFEYTLNSSPADALLCTTASIYHLIPPSYSANTLHKNPT